MKKLTFILALVLPLASLADSPSHEIIPGVRFGMPSNPAKNALVKFRESGAGGGTAKLRHSLITSTVLQPGKLTSSDRLVPYDFVPNTGPVFNSLEILSMEQPAYESVRTAWADFKDIADSKFKRVGGTGVFPPATEFASTDKDVVTDTYEAEGMRIELAVRLRNYSSQGNVYNVAFNITPVATAASPSAAAK